MLDNGVPAVMVTCSADGSPERHGHLAGLLRRRDARRAVVPVLQQDHQERAREPARVGRACPTSRASRTGCCSSSSSARRRRGRSSTPWTCRSRRSRRRPACPASSSCGPPTSTGCSRSRSSPIRSGPADGRPDRDDRTQVATALRHSSRARPPSSRCCSASSAEINATLDLEEIYDIALRTMDELFEFHHANHPAARAGRRHADGRREPRLREPGDRRTRAHRHRRDRHRRAEAEDAAAQQSRAAARVRGGAAAADGEVRPRRGDRRRRAGARPARMPRARSRFRCSSATS